MGTHKLPRKLREELESGNRYFAGPARATSLRSIGEVLDAYTITCGEVQVLKEVIRVHLEQFVNEFYDYVDVNKKKVDEKFLDACKVRHKDLKSLIELVGSTDTFADIFVVTRSRTHVYEISQMRYVPSGYELITLDDEGDLIDLYRTSGQPKIYRHLHKAMIRIIHLLQQYGDKDEPGYYQTKQLALAILSFAGIYNEFNPDKANMRKFEEKTLSILTQLPQPIKVDLHDDRNYRSRAYFDTLLNEVVKDIYEGKFPYIRDFSNALIKARSFLDSPYSEEDYYFAQTAAASKWEMFEYKQTLLHSAWETDPFRGCQFDEVTGYQSHYNLRAPTGAEMPMVVTFMITNGSKYKPRAIHIGLNAIQDRGAYIHRRLARFLSFLPEDCTKVQERGHLFLRRVTNPEYRKARGWPSALAMDWSNATDRLDQDFQCNVLRIFFPEGVVQFWDQLSKCDKVFLSCNGKQIPYKQVCGQPQGLLGSFDAFAVAHHLIMLMTMKASGLEDEKYSDFCRILGDDSIISSIKADPTNIVGDMYCQICAYANMEIERNKSTEVLCDQHNALADFAKVTVSNGEFFSPVPTRLALRSGCIYSNYYNYSMLLWMHSKETPVRQRLLEITDRYYPDELDNTIMRACLLGGFSSRFEDFSNPDILDEKLLDKVKLCYLISKVRMSFAQTLLGDKIRENLSLTSYTVGDALERLIPKDPDWILDLIEDRQHKLLLEIERNLLIEDTIKSVLGLSNVQTLLPSLHLTLEETQFLVSLADLTANLEYLSLDTDEEMRSLLDRTLRDVKLLDRFNMRSDYKGKAFEIMVCSETIALYRKIFGVLPVPATP